MNLKRCFKGCFINTFARASEQNEIATFLDQKTSKIDNLVHKIQPQIATLKEYHQALISNVVTGKVRVYEN